MIPNQRVNEQQGGGKDKGTFAQSKLPLRDQTVHGVSSLKLNFWGILPPKPAWQHFQNG